MAAEIDFRALEDSQPVLPKGAIIDPSRPLEPIVRELGDWVRSVRGGMLAGSFYIERNLNVIIEAYFLKLGRDDDAVSLLFHEEVLNGMSFERRVNTVVKICEIVLPDEAKAMRSDLGNFRAIRNSMAHNPCWFEGIADDKSVVVELAVRIRKGKGILKLDRALVDEWNDLTVGLISSTKRLGDKVIDPQTL